MTEGSHTDNGQVSSDFCSLPIMDIWINHTLKKGHSNATEEGTFKKNLLPIKSAVFPQIYLKIKFIIMTKIGAKLRRVTT